MNSEETGSRTYTDGNYNDEQLAYLEQLASIGFSPRKIAITFGVPTRLMQSFINEIEKEGSTLNAIYLRGQYKTEAEAKLNIANSSKSSIAAFQEMKKSQIESDIDELKRSLEPGYELDTTPTLAIQAQYNDSLDYYHALKELVNTGNCDKLPAHLQEYWQRLSVAHDLISNFQNRAKGRRFVIRQLKLKYSDLSERQCYRIINESISFFNVDIDRNHWKNILCESLDKAIAVAWKMNRMDWIIKAIHEQALIQGLHLEEKEAIPEELLEKKVIVISSNAKEFGYEPVARKDLLEQIKKYDISRRDKQRLAKDAGITDLEFEEA